jgi:hypothetical protein
MRKPLLIVFVAVVAMATIGGAWVWYHWYSWSTVLEASVYRIPEHVWNKPQLLRNLQRLRVSGTIPTDRWRIIAALPNLTSLDASGSKIDDAAVSVLSESRSLREFFLWDTRVTDVSIPSLCEIRQLESIDLGLTNITADGVMMMLQRIQLQMLNLVSIRVSDRLACEIGKQRSLRSLVIESEALTMAGLRCLAEINSLQSLDLTGRHLTPDEILLFAMMPHLTSFGCSADIDSAHMHALSRLSKLQSLRIDPLRSKIEISAFAKLRSLASLRTLTIQPYIPTVRDTAALRRYLPGVEIISGD